MRSASGQPSPDGRDEISTRLVYQGTVGGIGEFRCPAGCRAWEVENSIGAAATIAFARDPVGIAQADREAVVATPNEAMLYNPHSSYRRRLLDPHGDRCEYISIQTHVLAEIVREHDPRAADRPERPLRWAWAPVESGVYIAQRALYHHVRMAENAGRIDRLLVDERIVNIVDEVVARAARGHGARARRASTARDHRVWIEGAKDYLARNFRRSLSLDGVSAAVGISVFHLCRLFKAHAGTTVHDYVRALRVRAALDGLADASLPIGAVADGLGFCNQSHFTRAFRAEFGLTPSEVRRALRDGIADRSLLGAVGDARAS